MTKFYSLPRKGILWLAVVANGRLHWLHPQARVGDCYRPGQRISVARLAATV